MPSAFEPEHDKAPAETGSPVVRGRDVRGRELVVDELGVGGWNRVAVHHGIRLNAPLRLGAQRVAVGDDEARMDRDVSLSDRGGLTSCL